MPRIHKLLFNVFSVREFKDENHEDGLCLEYFASLQNIKVNIYIDYASDAEVEVEVEEVEASLQRAARVHPNHPIVETDRYNAPMFPEWKAWAARYDELYTFNFLSFQIVCVCRYRYTHTHNYFLLISLFQQAGT